MALWNLYLATNKEVDVQAMRSLLKAGASFTKRFTDLQDAGDPTEYHWFGKVCSSYDLPNEAYYYHRFALSIREKKLDPTHPLIAISREILQTLLIDLGNRDWAEAYDPALILKPAKKNDDCYRAQIDFNRCREFIGREAQLAHLQSLVENHPYIVVNGPRGIGKTTLLSEFAYRQKDKYDRIRLIPATTSFEVDAGLEKLADEFLVSPGRLQGRLSELQHQLAVSKQKVLLIFDAADQSEVAEYLDYLIPQLGPVTVLIASLLTDFQANVPVTR